MTRKLNVPPKLKGGVSVLVDRHVARQFWIDHLKTHNGGLFDLHQRVWQTTIDGMMIIFERKRHWLDVATALEILPRTLGPDFSLRDIKSDKIHELEWSFGEARFANFCYTDETISFTLTDFMYDPGKNEVL